MVTPDQLKDALKSHFGFDRFKGNQEEIIMCLLAEQDAFVLMPTGGGKSLCYQLPALLMKGTAIVVSPLIALMKNQVDAMRGFSSDGSIAHFLNSSLTKGAIEEVKADITAGRTKLLYVAPESLTKQENIDFLKSVPVSFYAIDEAHCISEWGHDFRPEYRRLRTIIDEIGPRPVIALTATATPKVQLDIRKNMGMARARLFKDSFNRRNLYYEVRPKTQNVDRDIIRFIKANPHKSGIVYCLSRKRVEELAELLKINDITCMPYHAGMDSATRAANQDAFLKEQVDVIVATIAFGMGIDKPDVRYVIHYDIPKSLEGYYQETGRAGRDGGEGRCIAFYSTRDLRKLEKFMQSKPVAEQEIGRQLLLETAAYATSSVCRRKTLLHYFGEEYDNDNCGACDNCLNPRRGVECAAILSDIIETIDSLKIPFRTDHIVDIVRGRATTDVRNYHHETLSTFGSHADVELKLLSAVIRQAVLAGILHKELETLGTITLLPKAYDYIDGKTSFKVIPDADFSKADDYTDETEGQITALDQTLYSMLSALRQQVARKHDLPPYVIFQDPSLSAMATFYPETIEELQNIPGVGQGKARRYGNEFVKLIKEYVHENDIEIPKDVRVRTLAPNSKLKIFLIQAIDRKISLSEFAQSNGLDQLGLLDELEAIVYSGTKVNINYYLEEILDEDAQEEIYDYFRQSSEDDLTKAYNDLDQEYSEEELRLMRIKFLSEMAN